MWASNIRQPIAREWHCQTRSWGISLVKWDIQTQFIYPLYQNGGQPVLISSGDGVGVRFLAGCSADSSVTPDIFMDENDQYKADFDLKPDVKIPANYILTTSSDYDIITTVPFTITVFVSWWNDDWICSILILIIVGMPPRLAKADRRPREKKKFYHHFSIVKYSYLP